MNFKVKAEVYIVLWSRASGLAQVIELLPSKC
jgi:hypothetical protein